ncbi:MAG: hypothetical protein FJ265_13090 [Planctomycetes bacterium]|nr:hypothetical protein [Planctomycetota bacterium]
MPDPGASPPAPRPRAQWPGQLALAAAMPALLVAARAAAGPSRQAFEAHLLYATVAAVLLLFAAVLTLRIRAARGRRIAALRQHAPGLLSALALTALVLFLSPPELRVQFDETSLVGTSQNLHERRMATMTTAAIPFDGAVLALESTVDKRPPLFAFLVSLVHDATGYRIGNAFAVNAALLFVLLASVHAAVRRRLGAGFALPAQALLVATPLVPVVATSAGFELLALVLLARTTIAALDAIAGPSPLHRATFLANGLLFAWSRYESVLLFLLLLLLVALRTRGRAGADNPVRWLLAAMPGLLTPLAFLFVNAARPDFYPEAAGQPLVSLQHGLDHAVPFLGAWLGGAFTSAWPAFAAPLGLVGWLLRLGRRRGTTTDLLLALPVLAATAIACCWFYGDVGEPTALRLFLPAAALGALLPLAWADPLRRLGPRAVAIALAGTLLFAAARLVPLAQGTAFPRLQIARATAAIDAALRAVPGEPGRTLWVTFAAQHLAVKGHAALCAEAFFRRNADVRQLITGRHAAAVLVLETPFDAAFAPAFGDVRDVLARAPGEVVYRGGGDVPVTVHRLRW